MLQIIKLEQALEPLSWEERQLVPLFVKSLAHHIEQNNAIKGYEIVNKCKAWAKYNNLKLRISAPRVARIIRHIRLNHLLLNLFANSQGYYITNDLEELNRYIISKNQQANAINQISDALSKDFDDITSLLNAESRA